MPDGAALPVRTWLPRGTPSGAPRAVVLALHGFNDSRDAWEIPGPAFASGGHRGLRAGTCAASARHRAAGAGPAWPRCNRTCRAGIGLLRRATPASRCT